jgi:hypothetical protein
MHQGHMACNCLKNVNAQNISNCQSSNVQEVSTTSTATTTATPPALKPTPSIPLLPPPKLSYTQQIQVIKAKMSDEEHSLYLNACNMGEDFCSAGL